MQELVLSGPPPPSRRSLQLERSLPVVWTQGWRVKARTLLAMLAASLTCSACATYQPPSSPSPPAEQELSAAFPVPKDSLLRALVEFAASSRMFVLENVDSNSGTVFLQVESGPSRDFVDCGHFERPWIPFKYHSFDGSYKEFLLFRRADASLGVRLAVVLIPTSPDRTRATVSGNFELKSRQEASVIWTAGRFITWDFSSGRPKTKFLAVPAWGSGQERTCKSTLDAERMALQTIDKLAERLSTRGP